MFYTLIIINTLLGAIGGLLIKISSCKENSQRTLIEWILSKEFILGTFFYVIAIIMNIILLKHIQYIVFIACLSLTYVWTLFLSNIYLKEKITRKKLLAISLIIIGTIIVSI
ncbi:EamA family transporter [Oceanirhabdus sp. W0125-5]|uniref:EamA family transporter n=1 Tax=Oceanirhabdus sp. W0125-5 TaxID=2999116 RepID=UPI0022F2F949|nr:EamA family transporter [Oceanirhabdus sp. W0125-5]WBW99204.1 EamA family transporter [Oceanirhabdus sp. W0125-5]